MPVLAALLSGILGNIAGFFATFVTKKVALGASALVMFASLTVIVMFAIATAINVVLALPSLPHWVAVGFSLFMPTNFVGCVSALIGGHIAVATYRYHVETLRIVSYIT